MLPALERHHDVLAPTLAAHAGGPPIEGELTDQALVDAVERSMDDAGFETAHLAGNSLGGHVALKLAERGRARSVVALAPAGAWAEGDGFLRELLALQKRLHELAHAAAPHADAIVSTPQGRRQATQLSTVRYEHVPAELLAHQMRAAAALDAGRLIDHATNADWSLDAERITCPVRIVWGAADALLPWPAAAIRLRDEWLPHADWVVLDDVGHCPQLDVPLETAQLIVGFTSR